MSIKHVVVVMLENRSYDNVLGWLYNTRNAAPYTIPPPGQADLNGLTGNESNPNPLFDASNPVGPGNQPVIPVNNQTALSQVNNAGTFYPATCIPVVDPGEFFGDMAQQFLGGTAIPSTNPYTAYPPAGGLTMQGFTANYLNPTFKQPGAPDANVGDMMNAFTPEQLPVTSFLANNFAVCDQWFASVPTQTFTNRAFALTAAPALDALGGYSLIDDSQYFLIDGLTSVLAQFDSTHPVASGGPPNWKVYFHDYSIAMMTVPYVKQQSELSSNNNVATFDQTDWGTSLPNDVGKLASTFVADVTANPPTLPPFAFIEPRYGTYNVPPLVTQPPNSLPANSNHPGAGYKPVSTTAPPIDMASGELLLMQVYNLLSGNAGLWAETLLVITYDEHGGIYDHVPPPPAVAPGSSVPTAKNDGAIPDPAAEGFNFNILGGRVPAIIVSPCIAPSSTVRSSVPFDHTSIIKTLFDLFGLATTSTPFLTQRDAAAPSLVPFLAASSINATAAFSGTILCGPSSLAFGGSGTFVAFAAAASTTLAATVVSGGTWLSIATESVAQYPAATPLLQITATAAVGNLPSGTYTGAIQVTGGSLNPAVIPVTLTVS